MVPRWDPSAQVTRLHKWHRSLQHGQFSFLRYQHHILNFEQVNHNVHNCQFIFQPCDNRNNYKGPEQSDFGERPEDLSWKLLLSGSLSMSDKPLISILFQSKKNVFSLQGKNRAGWGSVSNTGDLVDNVLKL